MCVGCMCAVMRECMGGWMFTVVWKSYTAIVNCAVYQWCMDVAKMQVGGWEKA